MDKNNARKRLLIYPNFQLRLIVGLFVSHLVLISVFFITQTVFFNTYKKLGQQMGLPADHMFFGFVDQQRHKMILFLLVASALVMILGAVYSLVVSHRVAGPIVRAIRYLNDYGDQPQSASQDAQNSGLKFRDHDFFKELADSINRFVSRQGSSR
jgi:hypothetical protein